VSHYFQLIRVEGAWQECRTSFIEVFCNPRQVLLISSGKTGLSQVDELEMIPTQLEGTHISAGNWNCRRRVVLGYCGELSFCESVPSCPSWPLNQAVLSLVHSVCEIPGSKVDGPICAGQGGEIIAPLHTDRSEP
jgi:hypothetical protein